MPNGIVKTKGNKDKEIILSIIKYSMIAAIVLCVLFFGVKLFALLIPIVIGFVLAHASNTFSKAIYKLVRRKNPRSLEKGGDTKGYRILKLINFVLLLLLFIGIIIFIFFALIAQVRNLINLLSTSMPATEIINNISTWLNGVSKYLGGILPESAITLLSDELVKIQNDILAALPKITTSVLNSILGFIGNIPWLFFQAIVIVMSGYYYITDKIVIGKFIRELLPSEVFVSKIVNVVSKVSKSLFRVFGGYAVIMMVTFTEAIIGLSIIKMPYIVILALIVTFVDILPAVGASACFYPIAVYMFIQGRIFEGFVALAFVGIMTLVRTLLEPKVIGTAMKLHPLATLTAMIIGVAAFGFVGFLLGPMIVVLITGIMDSFGFKEITREWFGKILNKVAFADSSNVIISNVPVDTVKHVVMWKLKEQALDNTMIINSAIMKEKLRTLPALIPEILNMEIGEDTKFVSDAYDIVLITTFASYDDLTVYMNHPAHKEVAAWIKQVVSSRNVIDFDISMK